MAFGDETVSAMQRVFDGLGGATADAATLLTDRIRTRTRAGQSATGGAFVGYHPRYIRQKGSPLVDLTSNMPNGPRHGVHMLDDMGPVSEDSFRINPAGRGSRVQGAGGRFISPASAETTIGFRTPEKAELAQAHHEGRWGMRQRPFFGFTEQDVIDTADLVNRSLVSVPSTEEFTIRISL